VFGYGAFDQLGIGRCPFDRPTQAFADFNLRNKSQLTGRLLSRGKAFAGTIPVACWFKVMRCLVPSVLIDDVGQVKNGRFSSGSEVIDAASGAFKGASHQATCHVFHKYEVAAGVTAIVQRQRLAMQ